MAVMTAKEALRQIQPTVLSLVNMEPNDLVNFEMTWAPRPQTIPINSLRDAWSGEEVELEYPSSLTKREIKRTGRVDRHDFVRRMTLVFDLAAKQPRWFKWDKAKNIVIRNLG